MTAADYAQLRDLVANGELDVGVLTSDEVAVALGVADDPSLDDVQRAALATAERSLAARGLVDRYDDSISLHGVLGLVRLAYLDSDVTVRVDHIRDGVAEHRSAYRLVDGVSLVERISADGVHRFVLREPRAAVAEALEPTVAARIPKGASARTVSPDELAGLAGAAVARAAVGITQRLGEGQVVEAGFGLLADADGTSWALSEDDAGAVTVVPIDLKQGAELVEAIAAEAAPATR